MKSGSVLMLHGYDSRNSGDGLLVTGALDLVEDAGYDLTQVTLVAMVPDSFAFLRPKISEVIALMPPMDTRAKSRVQMVASAVETWVSGSRLGRRSLRRRAAEADLIVGVGGAYLQAEHLQDVIVTAAYHLPQLQVAAACSSPSVYLPQSIGPLAGPTGSRIRRALAGIGTVACRDDLSFDEIGRPRNALRMPDTAVLAVAQKVDAGRAVAPAGGRVAIIGRKLRDAPDLIANLRVLGQRLPDAMWAVQSRAQGQDDLAFYRTVGVESSGPAADVLGRPDVSATIAIRLHGALESILQGVPAVHLGYERKAAGAYADLGISKWLHDARTFDPIAVAEQARELADDPAPFWASVNDHLPRLRDQRERLVEILAAPST